MQKSLVTFSQNPHSKTLFFVFIECFPLYFNQILLPRVFSSICTTKSLLVLPFSSVLEVRVSNFPRGRPARRRSRDVCRVALWFVEEMADDKNVEKTIAEDLVVTKYKMAGEIVNSEF